MVHLTQKGDFKKTEKMFEKFKDSFWLKILDKYAQAGVEALASATPRDTGKTAASWDYRIERNSKETKIVWTNSNVNEGVNIAVIIQYGHGTGTGGYVQGVDYINPAIRPVFDHIVEEVVKEVRNI